MLKKIGVVLANILFLLLLVFFVWGYYTGWSFKTYTLDMTYDQAFSSLKNAEQFVVKGDLDDFVQKPTVWVGDKYIGKLEDEGWFDWKFRLLIGNEDAFYIAHSDPELTKLCRDNRFTSIRYAYFSPEKNLIGYAEKTTVQFKDSTKKDVFLFYDKDKKEKNYFYCFDYDSGNGWSIISRDGDVLVTGSYEFHSFSSEYEITVETYRKEVDLSDKILLCSFVLASIRGNHNQR